MHEQAHIGAVADLAEPAFAVLLRLIVDLAGILNRQHVPALGRRGYKHRPVRHHLLDRHRLVRQETANPELLGAIVREVANTHRLPLRHAPRDKLPTSLAPFVAEIAKSCIHRRLLESRRHTQNHAGFCPRNPNRTAARLNRSATSAPKLAPVG